MPRTIEAVISPDVHVRLLEAVSLSEARRALATVPDESADADISSALLSEAALADWNGDDEDAAWAQLQQEP